MAYIYRRGEDIDREPTAPYVTREDVEDRKRPRPSWKAFNPELCGTTKGYWQHRRYYEPQCPRCSAAQTEYTRDYRARKETG